MLRNPLLPLDPIGRPADFWLDDRPVELLQPQWR